jgi:hypothetical protein
MSAYTVCFDTRRYFGAKRHATLEAAFDYMMANIPRSFCIVARDANGRRYSVRDVQNWRKKP